MWNESSSFDYDIRGKAANAFAQDDRVVGVSEVVGVAAVGGFDAKVLFRRFINSMGKGKTIVVFFSTPISVRVWR
jgi:hypothetical protein